MRLRGKPLIRALRLARMLDYGPVAEVPANRPEVTQPQTVSEVMTSLGGSTVLKKHRAAPK